MSSPQSFSRRDLIRLATASFAGATASGWLPGLAARAANEPTRKGACILLWMTGGPSQTDTLDMKTGHANGGSFKPIDTSVSGIQISEHLPLVAQQMEHISLIRSMSTKEGDHSRATYLLRTGHLPQGPIHYPTMGAALSKELGRSDADLPNYVSIAPYQFLSPAAFGPGFLGPQYSPLVVGGPEVAPQFSTSRGYAQGLGVRNLALPANITTEEADARFALLDGFEDRFAQGRAGVSTASHRSAYQAAVRMMRSDAAKAFELEGEPEALRDAYGRSQFGQGCLLARRLVERGVPFVEVTLRIAPGSMNSLGWDTHQNNFDAVKALSASLDPAWATLIRDLKERGLLDSTMVIWMGEFGRTPVINANAGRDHFPAAWSVAIGGGGIPGGQVVGKTSNDGMTVEDRPVAVADLIATICKGLGLDPTKQNMSNVGRPIRLADPDAKPIEELL